MQPHYLASCLVRLQKQRGSVFQKRPQPDLIVPAHRVLSVAQGEDSVDGTVSQQMLLQFFYKKYTQPSIRGTALLILTSNPPHTTASPTALLPDSSGQLELSFGLGKQGESLLSGPQSKPPFSWFSRGTPRAFRPFHQLPFKSQPTVAF